MESKLTKGEKKMNIEDECNIHHLFSNMDDHFNTFVAKSAELCN